MIGFSLGLIASYVGSTFYLQSLFAFEPPVWLSSLFVSLNVLLPLTANCAYYRNVETFRLAPESHVVTKIVRRKILIRRPKLPIHGNPADRNFCPRRRRPYLS